MLMKGSGYANQLSGIGGVSVHWLSSLEKDNGNEETRFCEMHGRCIRRMCISEKEPILRV